MKQRNGFDALQQSLASGRFPPGPRHKAKPWAVVISAGVTGGVALTALALPVAIWVEGKL